MSGRTRIKICGITRSEDAAAAADAGVDAVGFVFVPASKRYIGALEAANIANQLPAFVSKVGLFLNAEPNQVQDVLLAFPDCTPQFHGEESAEYCDAFNRPYIKAFSYANFPANDQLQSYKNAMGYIVDSHDPGELGGTGKTFDWDLLNGVGNSRLILAGGLDASNIEDAIRRVRPYAVDLSSAVESAKGIKDAALIHELVSKVVNTDSALSDSYS